MKNIFFLGIIFLIACSTLNKVNNSNILLEKMEKLEFTFDREKVLEIMGEPSEKLQRQGSESWIYRNADKLQTAALGFDGKTGLLKGKMLFLVETDKLANPEEAKKHFKNINFEIVEPPWENPHAGPNELFYVNKQFGIKLIFSESHKLFESISWWDVKNPPPARTKSKVPYKL